MGGLPQAAGRQKQDGGPALRLRASSRRYGVTSGEVLTSGSLILLPVLCAAVGLLPSPRFSRGRPLRVAAMSSLAAQDAYLQGLARKVCAQNAPESRKRKFGKAATLLCGNVGLRRVCLRRVMVCGGVCWFVVVLSKTCDTGFLHSKLAFSSILTRVRMARK